MMLPDVNVLVYAFRKDVPLHAASRAWLKALIDADEPFGVSRLALSAVVRVTTMRAAFQAPSALEEAFGFCDDIVAQPRCLIVEPGDRHWGIFQRLCRSTGTTGRRVSDAWFAALAIESGCEWITFDRDFGRFPGLRWRAPAAA